MDDILELISTTKEQDQYGVWRETPHARPVFCQTKSVTRSEFFSAGRNGLNPEYMFTVWAGDYLNERTCRYRGQGYAIYRSYKAANSDYVELYVQREGGTNGEGHSGHTSG